MRNLQDEWARLLIGSLADAGVRDAVLSPGSRSTPFVLAAARHPGLRCHDVIDERAAAYFALGQARVTGRPSLLVCTSGTAGANYLPAVIEAEASYVPLVVLTADRPVDLVGCGANQTIDQLALYGGHVRRFFELGEGDGSPRALRALRRTAAQAVAAALHPEPGPVHLNARARKPLEPQEPATEDERRLHEEVDALLGRPLAVAVPRLFPDPGALGDLAAACRVAERGWIVAGPAPLAQAADAPAVVELARRTGFPMLADAASQLRYRGPRDDDVFVDAFGLLLGDETFRRGHRPELIVQIGRAPTAGSWEKALAEHTGEHWLIGPYGWNDPESTATRRLIAEVGPAVSRLIELLEARPAPTAWSQAFRQAEEKAQGLIEEELDDDALSEGSVARQVVGSLPAGGLLAVGNSLPIREVDVYARGGRAELSVVSQRGTSGIDGVTSGALGAAVAAERPAALLTGDVSFLHDLSGLWAARHVTQPFALVVVQNRGGRIFEMLPVADHPAARGDVFDHWLTTHGHDFAHAAALFGLPFTRAATRSALAEGLREALARPGVTVIEAVVPPSGAAEQNRRLAERLRQALAGMAFKGA